MSKSKELEITPKYTYNKDGDTYVIPVKHRVKPFVISGYKIRAIRKAISNAISSSETGSEICLKYRLQVDDFDAIKKAFDLTRDSFPLTDEEVDENSVDQSKEKILEEKRTATQQEVEKEEWRETLKDASSWRKFVTKQFDPFQGALDTWIPPKQGQIVIPKLNKIDNQTLVIGLSDLHYGASGKARYMFNRPDWTTEKTVACVQKYAQDIVTNVLSRGLKFTKVIILGLGDLIHSVNGKTARGTELIYDCVREEQFEYALTSLTSFIKLIAKVIPTIEIHSVYGNHNYEAEMALFRALEMYFNPQTKIKFFHYSSRPACFREGNTLFLLDHGADSIEKAYVPTNSDTKLQVHVQSLLLQMPEKLLGAKEKLFCIGDKHHWEHIEYNDFQFIMFGTVLGGDQHSAVHNLKNRARQSCLVLDDNGLREVIHCYFD